VLVFTVSGGIVDTSVLKNVAEVVDVKLRTAANPTDAKFIIVPPKTATLSACRRCVDQGSRLAIVRQWA
jgi:hypothetical protein